jgi:hypothetical protein
MPRIPTVDAVGTRAGIDIQAAAAAGVLSATMRICCIIHEFGVITVTVTGEYRPAWIAPRL